MPTTQRIKRLVPAGLRGGLRRAASGINAMVSDLSAYMNRPNLYRLRSGERIGVVYGAPSEMSIEERLFLYALVRGRRPERVLEIGSCRGGSAAIIACALEDNGAGRVIGVDPTPAITVSRRALHGRFRLVAMPSPEGLAEARELAGGPFDLALIDGIHIRDQVVRDIDGCLPHLSEGACILFHDAFHFGVSAAIHDAIAANDRLHDCGYVCITPYTAEPLVAYRGLRMLRFASGRIADPQPLIEEGYRAAGLSPPQPHPDLYNHDGWYCRAFEPCPRCRADRAGRVPDQAPPAATGPGTPPLPTGPRR